MTSSLRVPDPSDRADLATLLRRLLALDEAAVVRLVDAGEDRLRMWARTPFGALVSRVVRGAAPGGDVVVAADHLALELAALSAGDRIGELETGMPLTSAWSALLPPASGFVAAETVPAQVLLDLAADGRAAARQTAGPLGAPPSLLDGVALVASAESSHPVEVEMRAVLALTACGFVPTRQGRAPEDEPVRISSLGPWVRLDARYGTVHRRPETLPLDSGATGPDR